MNKDLVIVGVTGHRKLSHPQKRIKHAIKERLNQLQADVVVTGMALGFDMLVAEVCVEEDIPFIAAIPCKGQTRNWPSEEKGRWITLMDKVYKFKVISPGEYKIWKLLKRNEWIVERSNYMLAYWNGKPKGGTFHCWNYAKKLNKFKENIYEQCSLR